MSIIIKDAQLVDLNNINNLMRLSKAHCGYEEKFLDRYMHKLGISEKYLEENSLQLLYIDSHLTGFYNLVTHVDDTLELDNFYIHPGHLGKGLGRKMWNHCCSNVKQTFAKNEFIVWSDPHAEKFYLHMGCKKIGERPSPMAPDRYPPILKYTFSD